MAPKLNPVRFIVSPGDGQKKVECLKCERSFWSPVDRWGIALRRICPCCAVHNQSPGTVYEIGLNVGRIRRRAAL